jgi:hypothetical protein
MYGEENIAPFNNDAFFTWDHVPPVDKPTAGENLPCYFNKLLYQMERR